MAAAIGNGGGVYGVSYGWTSEVKRFYRRRAGDGHRVAERGWTSAARDIRDDRSYRAICTGYLLLYRYCAVQ
jgi:hypothetical protein